MEQQDVHESERQVAIEEWVERVWTTVNNTVKGTVSTGEQAGDEAGHVRVSPVSARVVLASAQGCVRLATNL